MPLSSRNRFTSPTVCSPKWKIDAANTAFDAYDNKTGCTHMASAIDLTQQILDQLGIMLPVAADAGYDPAGTQDTKAANQKDLDSYQAFYSANCTAT